MNRSRSIAHDRLVIARRMLTIAERRNAAATLARVEPPFTPDQIRDLRYAVVDTQDEACGIPVG